MSEDYVWVSALFKSGTLERAWNIDLYYDGIERSSQFSFSNYYGLHVANEDRPRYSWAHENYPPIKKLPPVFDIRNALVVSEAVSHVFADMDLGEGSLLPMEQGIFQSEQVTKLNGNYFSWVIGNKKTTVLLNETKGKMKLNPRGEVWHLQSASSMVDDSVVVSRSALDGVDQWVDPTLQKSLFLGRRFGDAIVDAGLKEAFFLYRCPVI